MAEQKQGDQLEPIYSSSVRILEVALKDRLEAMNNREEWWERVRDIHAGSTPWWWWFLLLLWKNLKWAELITSPRQEIPIRSRFFFIPYEQYLILVFSSPDAGSILTTFSNKIFNMDQTTSRMFSSKL